MVVERVESRTLGEVLAFFKSQPAKQRREQKYRKGYCQGFAAAIECLFSVTRRQRGYDAAWDFHDEELRDWYSRSIRENRMELPPHFNLWKRNARHKAHPDNAKWQRVRLKVLERDTWTCRYCSRPANHVDHVLPKSRGGKDVLDNLVAACRRCNCSKGARTPEEAGMVLRLSA